MAVIRDAVSKSKLSGQEQVVQTSLSVLISLIFGQMKRSTLRTLYTHWLKHTVIFHVCFHPCERHPTALKDEKTTLLISRAFPANHMAATSLTQIKTIRPDYCQISLNTKENSRISTIINTSMISHPLDHLDRATVRLAHHPTKHFSPMSMIVST